MSSTPKTQIPQATCQVDGHNLDTFIRDMRRGEGLTPMQRFLDNEDDRRWLGQEETHDRIPDQAKGTTRLKAMI